jgi:hypothetical protein
VSVGSASATGAGPKVFICYRREETAAYAGRLYDALVARLGEGNVFMDLDLAPGLDFVERITDAVGACRVLLVVMGPRWATVAQDGESPRIADPEDYVRLEVETALRRDDVTVIPVLVAGAQMPDRDDLPTAVQAITRRNALELSDGRWRYDVGRLIQALDELLVGAPAVEQVPAPEPPERPEPRPPARAPWPPNGSTQRLVGEAVLVAGVVAFFANWIAWGLFADVGGPPTIDIAKKIAYAIARRTETWAIVGAGVAVWLAARTHRGDLVRCGVRGLVVGAIAGALGGAIVAFAAHLPTASSPALGIDHPLGRGGTGDWLEVASVAITGGLVGGLIGGIWRPRSRGTGFLSGAGAGALIAMFLLAVGWNPSQPAEAALSFGIRAAVIVGAVVATLALAAERARAPGDAEMAGAERAP